VEFWPIEPAVALLPIKIVGYFVVAFEIALSVTLV
jgi:hypothetical protein